MHKGDKKIKLAPYVDNWPLIVEASRLEDEHNFHEALAVMRYAKRNKLRITKRDLMRR
jgi:hypothetical protein